jgi:hypothetical protein
MPVIFLIIPLFGAALIPGFIVLTNMPAVVSWCLDHGAANYVSAVNVVVIVILLGTGALLILMLAVFVELEERHLEKTRSVSRRPESADGIGGLTKTLDSLNDSINRIKELSKTLNEQTRMISLIRWRVQNLRDSPPVEIRNMCH